MLIRPCVPLICARSPLFALVQPHVLSIHARLTSDQAVLPPHVTIVEPGATAMISDRYLLDIIVNRTKKYHFRRVILLTSSSRFSLSVVRKLCV